VDTLPHFAGLPGDAENNSGDALKAMQPLLQAAADRLGVMVVRHERKSGGSVGDSGRGSSAFAGAADTVVAIRRLEGLNRKTLRLIQSVSRLPDVPDELVVDLTPEGYVPKGEAHDIAAQEAEAVILTTAPTTEDEACDLDELIDGSQISRSTAQRVTKKLRADGRLSRTGSGRKGDPYRFWLNQRDSAQTTL